MRPRAGQLPTAQPSPAPGPLDGALCHLVIALAVLLAVGSVPVAILLMLGGPVSMALINLPPAIVVAGGVMLAGAVVAVALQRRRIDRGARAWPVVAVTFLVAAGVAAVVGWIVLRA